MRRLRIVCTASDAQRDEVMKLGAAIVTSSGAATLVDQDNDADLILYLVAGKLVLTNTAARGYMIAAYLDVRVRLFEGLSAAGLAQIEHDDETRELLQSVDGFFSPLLVAYEVGAPLAALTSRVFAHIVYELQEIEGLPIESILSRELRFVSDVPVAEDAALFRQIVSGEPISTGMRAPSLSIEHAMGRTSDEASENMREMKRSRVPRADAQRASDHDDFDARLRESLRRIETEIATINGTLLASEDLRPDYYRRCVQTSLYDMWQTVDDLAQSVEERSTADSTIGGFTLRYIRLGVLNEGFKLEVGPPPAQGTTTSGD